MLSNFNRVVIASILVSAIQPVLSEPVSIFGNPLRALARRQDGGGINASDIPAECATQCKPVADATNTPGCADPIPCFCTDTLANAFKACLDCAVVNDPADVSPELAQGSIDALTEACSTSGHPISIGGASSGSTTVSGGSGAGDATTTPATPGGTATNPTTTTSVGSSTASPLVGGDGSGATGTGTDTTSAPTTTTTNSGTVNLSVYSLSTVCAAVLAGAAFFGAF